MRYALLWLFRAVFFAVVISILWGAIYLGTRGVSRNWRDLVTQEIRKHGIDISMRKLTLDPINGLVAREVRFVGNGDQKRLFAMVDQIALDLNVANLINGDPFLDAVELRDAHLSLPVDATDKNSKLIQLSKLNARLLFPPGQVYVHNVEAEIFGIHVEASGRLLGYDRVAKKSSEKKTTATPQAQTPADWLSRIEDIRKQFAFSALPPRLEIRFSGDLNEPQNLFVDATLSANDFKFKGCPIRSLYAEAGLRERNVELRAFTMRDALGTLDCSGHFDLKDQTYAASLRSSMDVRPLIAALNQEIAAANLSLQSPPHIEASGSGNLRENRVAVSGVFDWGKFSVHGTEFDSASGGVSWNGSQLLLDNLTVRNRNGMLSARALNVPGDFRLILDSTINPRDLAPLLSGKAAQIMGEWEFATPPTLHLRVNGPTPDLAQCQANGEIRLGRTKFRNVPFKSATAKVKVKDGACTYQDFRVERDEGVGTGTFAYDFAKHEVRLNNLRMNLIPTDVAMWIDPRMVHDVAPYRFKAPPNILVDGTVTFDGRMGTRLKVNIDAPRGMDYTFLKKSLPFPDVRAQLEFTEGHLRIADLTGSLFGGKVRGSADICLKHGDDTYSAQIDANDVDFAKLTRLYFNYDDSHGKMDGSFKWSGDGDKPRSINGSGKLEVQEGNVFAIPMFGPLSGLLNNVLPGMGYNIARRGTATVKVKDGVIDTPDLKIEGSGFEMLGGGRLFFVDDRMDFTIRIDAQGVTGAILSPVSKLFEYTAQSSLSKPVWKPKRLSLPSARVSGN